MMVSFFISFILLSLTFGVVSADDPNIVDEEDNRLDYIDIIAGWFYETEEEPEYLYVSIQLADLTDHLGTVYAVHWEYDGVHYDVSFRNGIFFPHVDEQYWRCHYYERSPLLFWREHEVPTWDETTNNGVFDVDDDTITWKIHKSCIGDLEPGDELVSSYIFTAQRLSKVGLIPTYLIPFSHELSDTTDPSQSETYVIKY